MISQSWPKISIVTPSFNTAEFLEPTMKSVLDQNYPNLEYIVIDGASTDGSVDIIRKYQDRLAYWVSEKDAGHYDAVNKGFARSSGEIMGWLNSDDLYFPFTLRTVADVMRDLPEVSWLTTSNVVTWDVSGFMANLTQFYGYSREAYLDGRYLGTSRPGFGFLQQESMFWRRSLLEKAGGGIRKTYPLAGDFDLWGQFFLYANLYSIESVLGGFRFRPGQRSGAKDAYVVEARKSLDELRESLNWKPRFARSVADALGVTEIPKIRVLARRWLGYDGWRVARESSTDVNAKWKAARYRFL